MKALHHRLTTNMYSQFKHKQKPETFVAVCVVVLIVKKQVPLDFLQYVFFLRIMFSHRGNKHEHTCR